LLLRELIVRIFRTQGRSAKRTEAVIDLLERRGGASLDTVAPRVRKIVEAVRKQGEGALLKFAHEYDGLADKTNLRVTTEETGAAWQQLDPGLKRALETAAANIRAFAERQMPKSWSFAPVEGLATGQLIRPIESVGCYVPGGRHPLPSTMLMTVIPAQVAGVGRVVVTSPRPAPETLATAHLLGITEFYRVGGAHAIAALAYGVESIPKVNKIVGPGNLYVTAAKRAVAFDCAIDMLAGPTEIVVTSEDGAPEAIAADLIAQAEHDPEALAIFITTGEELAVKVVKETKVRGRDNPVAKEALKRNGYVFITGSRDEAQSLTNRLAPEHLSVDSEEDLTWVRNAGSVFVGRDSPQPMGDYISGPNHTLPTGGLAAVRGGLSVMDFVKLVTVQQYTAKGLAALGPHAIRLAEAEGLSGHAEAIRSRLQKAGKR
jgi:histidinol dehydrogenase